MGKPAAFFVLSLFTLALGCSNDKSTTPGISGEIVLATATIDSEGGTLAHEDFTLMVPAAAFATSATLKLSTGEFDHAFGNDARSAVYRITGLPDAFSQPLAVTIAYNGTLSAESYIAMGTEHYFAGEDEPAIFYDFLPATDSGGFLLAEIPAQTGGTTLVKAAKDHDELTGEKFDFLAIANQRLWVETSRFKIYYPVYLMDYIDELKSYLDDGYDANVTLGLGYDEKPWQWPINVIIFDASKAAADATVFFLAPENRGDTPKIIFNATKFSAANLPILKSKACWGMTLTALSTYVKDQEALRDPDDIWLHVAVADWSVELVAENPHGFVPQKLAGHELAIFSGLRAGAGSSKKTAWNHGWGVTPVIKFLMGDSRFGNDGLLRCYQYIKNGDEATTALIDALYNTEDEWFPDFFRAYLPGNIYGVGTGVLLAASNIAGTMNTITDTLKVFPASYPDLSARLYRVDLDSNSLPPGASISFTVDASQTNEDYVTTQIYRLKNNNLEFVEQGLNVTVGDVKEAARQGYDLIACVVNSSNIAPYLGSSALELTIRVERQLVYNWCRIDFGRVSYYVEKSNGEYEWKTDQAYSWEGQGAFAGNTFTATWDGIGDLFGPYVHATGNMTVVVDPQTLDVLSFAGHQTTVTLDGDFRTAGDISGGTVLFHETTTVPNPYLSCVEHGANACAAVTSFSHRYDWVSGQYWENLSSFSCTGESLVWITFWEWYGE